MRSASPEAPGRVHCCSLEFETGTPLVLTTTQTITCPYCWELIEVVLDLSTPEQCYVEDCFVCCRPIVIRYSTRDGVVEELSAQAESE